MVLLLRGVHNSSKAGPRAQVDAKMTWRFSKEISVAGVARSAPNLEGERLMAEDSAKALLTSRKRAGVILV